MTSKLFNNCFTLKKYLKTFHNYFPFPNNNYNNLIKNKSINKQKQYQNLYVQIV